MKPRTDNERRVVSTVIPPISKALERSIYALALPVNWEYLPYADAKRKRGEDNAWCCACGQTFKTVDYSLLINCCNVAKFKCPHCGRVIKRHDPSSVHGTSKIEQAAYVMHAQIVGEYQVLRYFVVSMYSNVYNQVVMEKPVEIIRRFYSQGKKVAVMATGLVMSPSFSRQPYRINSPLTLHSEEYHCYTNWYKLGTSLITPNSKWAPWLRRDGFKGGSTLNRLGINAYSIDAWNNPHMVTLVKAGYYELWRSYYRYDESKLTRHWPAIRQCLKHHYNPSYCAGTYIDYLDLCIHEHLDISNAHYACPDNIQFEHDRLNARLERRKQQEEMERRRKAIAQAESLFVQHIEKWRGLEISDGEITIKPLQSVQEFYDEGTAMHHCVFTNRYYDSKSHPNCLILSAKTNGERQETIEVSTKTFTVVQSRAKFNKESAFHARILQLMNNNMSTIKRIARYGKQTKAVRITANQ